ncbi:MAG: DsrE family protein [Methanomassiliicoccales archaeon]
MAESIAVLIRKPPYGTEEAFAGLRLSLAMLVSGAVERSTVILIGEGTLNAVATQEPGVIGMPSNMDAITDLTDFDAEVYCVREDLEELLGDVRTVDAVRMIDWEKARQVIDEHQLVTTF